jgi:hypothetical protein
MKSAFRGSGLPIFRTTTGKAWSKVNGVIRFIEARRKLDWDKDPVRKNIRPTPAGTSSRIECSQAT